MRGGFGGGGMRGGFGGGGFRGGFVGGGFKGGFGGFRGFRGFGFGNRGFFNAGFVNPWWGWGWGGGFWPGAWSGWGGYPLWDGYSDYAGYAGDGGYANYAGYSNPSPNVTVVFPPQPAPAPTTVVVERANPVMREYDEYGQEIRPRSGGGTAPAVTGPAATSGSPIFLIAFKDRVIRAAASYWVNGAVLHYVTLQREERVVPLDTVDRDLSAQLNAERHVAFQLPH
jgi:hypothetical protein